MTDPSEASFERTFTDRLEAARLLARRLDRYRGQNPLVLGIPRGAVPMARVIADALDGELDVVLVHKLRAPFQAEYAIGSVSESGDVYLSDAVARLEIARTFIDREVKTQLETLHRRRRVYTPGRPPIHPEGRIVIVVDNGVATGWTMIAALRGLRPLKPTKLIAAMAVAPPQAAKVMVEEADELVCLETPDNFFAVSQFFLDFREVTDEEVAAILSGAPVELSTDSDR
jgi:putative phosphoribosyl transferase